MKTAPMSVSRRCSIQYRLPHRNPPHFARRQADAGGAAHYYNLLSNQHDGIFHHGVRLEQSGTPALLRSGLVLFREFLAEVSWGLVCETPKEAAEVGRVFKIQSVGYLRDIHGGVDQKALGLQQETFADDITG